MRNFIGIDCEVKDSKHLTKRLLALKSTERVVFGGVYREDPALCQLHVVTTKTESEVDHWLWSTQGIGYIGTFTSDATKCGDF